MIDTVGELLHELLQRERAMLDVETITHAPTIGAMYEGLTQDALRRSIPVGAPLRVVPGFAVGSDGRRSGQLDCMLVVGDGRQIPFTPNWEFPIGQVVAVIEVKKNLTSSDLADGSRALAELSRIPPAPNGATTSMIEHAFELVTGVAFPGEKESLPKALQLVYHCLVTEAVSPARILLGYHGHKSEIAFRRALIALLENGVAQGKPIGPLALPHLIVNQRFSAVKANGLPWAVSTSDGWWRLWLTSQAMRPANALLDLIWGRLNLLGYLDASVFGDDRALDSMNLLASVKANQSADGWEMATRSAVVPKSTSPSPKPWEPVVVTEEESVILHFLCADGDFDVANPPGGSPSAAVLVGILGQLSSKGLVGLVAGSATVYRLVTIDCAVVYLADGRIVAGENNSGRLSRWVAERLA